MVKIVGIVSSLMLLITLSTAVPANGELIGQQNASWGLSDFGNSNTVANFSALGWAVEESDSRMFVGGNFLNVTNGNTTEPQPYLAAFHVRTGVWDESFTPDVERPVLTMEATPDGGLILGGEIRNYNGQDVSSLVKIDPATGDIWPGWNTRIWGGTNVVREVSLEPDGWLYAAGSFTNASDGGAGQVVSNLIRMNPSTGAIDWSWTPSITGGAVWGVSASRTNSTVYVVGWFTDAAGAASPAVGIDSNDPTSVTWDGFEMNYPCCGNMYDVEATEFGTVFVVGEQHASYVYDENQNMATITSHVTSHNTNYQDSNTRRGGDFQEIERVGNRIYTTCHCWGSHSSYVGNHQLTQWDLAAGTGVHTGRVSSIIAYDIQTGARDQSFNPYMAGDVGGFGVKGASDGCLWVTGGINAVGEPGNQAPARDLVRLCDENATPTSIEGPVSCTATPSGGTINVEWETVVGAVDYVIYRTVDGGNQSWRAKVAGASYADTTRAGELVYFVAAKGADDTRSEPTQCTSEPEIAPDISAPADCSVTIDGPSVEVEWASVEEAENYIVYRSFNGGQNWWRGKVSETLFSDTNRDGELAYSVLSEAADGTRSVLTSCVAGDPAAPDEPTPVASCNTEVNVDDPAQVEVSWSAAANVDQYVIYRTVDGGSQFWRGRTTETTFVDTLRGGDTVYFVSTKLGSQFSERVTCG